MNQHVASLLKRFRAVYGEPRSDEPDVLVAEYERALRGYSAAVLERAGSALIDGLAPDGKPRRFWPTISECRDACTRAAAVVAAEVKRDKPAEPEPQREPLTEEQRQKHRALMAEFSKAMSLHRGSMDQPPPPDWERGQREAIETLQDVSPNTGLHREA